MNNIYMSVIHMNNAHIYVFGVFSGYNPSLTAATAATETVKSAISAAGIA